MKNKKWPKYNFTERILQVNKGLEESAEGKKIYSKRNMFFLLFFFVVSIIFIVLAFRFVLKIDIKQFFGAVNSGFNKKIGYILFTCFIVGYLWSVAYTFLGYYPRLSSLNIHVPTWEYIIFSLTIAFFKGITPSTLFIDPYTMFWLKSKGLSTNKAASVVMTNSLIWQAAALIITLPSFIYLWITKDGFLKLVQYENWFTLLTIILGMVFNFLCLSGWFILCWSKKIHFIVSCIGNWCKKKLRMKYYTKEQIEQKYEVRATMRNNFIDLVKNWKITLLCFLIYACFESFSYLCICFGLMFTQQQNINIRIYMAFNCANVAITANTIFFFVPSGILTLDKFLKDLLTITNCWEENNINYWTKEKNVVNSIFLWRWFFTYLPTLTGSIGVIPLITIQIVRYKNKKKLQNVK